jgi:hypothetical protein
MARGHETLRNRLYNLIRIEILRARANYRVWQLYRQVAFHTPHSALNPQPVVFFNASTRITGLSQNAAFSLLAALGLQLAGVPVVNFACKAGLSRCVLGTAFPDRSGRPPCRACIAQSRWLFADAPTISFTYRPNAVLVVSLQDLSVDELSRFELRDTKYVIPLGPLVLPSIRWALRRHHLVDDEPTRQLFREYIQSAYNVAIEFNTLLDQVEPRGVVVFNGQFYPEATARWVATRRGLRVISHEVALQRFSAFFTDGEATAYPIYIPADFNLTPEQDARLDAYLEQRFQGNFSMAGIRFWPEMHGLDEAFLQRASRFRQIVPVFSNVIFDTSQPHSNVVFPHMFAWLDSVLEIIRVHPETLFVIRAHPDELRSGKASRESVAEWAAQRRVADLPNVLFINANEFISSYELIQRSKFVMVYNSSIGLEAALKGAAVLCAGRARYTQYPIVFFPPTPEAFRLQAEAFLKTEHVEIPEEFRRNARRFLYYQLYRTALPFGDYLEEDGIWPGFVRLRRFSWKKLTPAQSPAIRAIIDGIVNEKEFLLEED